MNRRNWWLPIGPAVLALAAACVGPSGLAQRMDRLGERIEAVQESGGTPEELDALRAEFAALKVKLDAPPNAPAVGEWLSLAAALLLGAGGGAGAAKFVTNRANTAAE